MNFRVFAVALVVPTFVLGRDIVPDWDKLTDFSTSFTMDLAQVLAMPGPPSPVTSFQGNGSVQLDVIGERFKMIVHGNSDMSSDIPTMPDMIKGAKITSVSELSFDLSAGYATVKDKATVYSDRGPFIAGFCFHVAFPTGLLPPGQMAMQAIDAQKPYINHMLGSMSKTEATVDGNDVAVIRDPDGRSPFVGVLTFDAVPVGFGLPPVEGAWAGAILKFSDWKAGDAGTIEDEPCVQIPTTELLQDHHAKRNLWVFDQVMSQLTSAEPLATALKFVPTQPSKVFESAAKLVNPECSAVHFNEMAKLQTSPTSSLVIAAVGFVIGGAFVLLLCKASRPSISQNALLG